MMGEHTTLDSSRVDVTLPPKETTMLAMWVKVRIKPEMRQKFLKAIEVDALGSERDEPGCMRFNVLRDEKDENVYYFYEVYVDQAALEQHRAAPHYATWRSAADSLDGPSEPTRCQTVFPAAKEYWTTTKTKS
ncbi:MAG: antibiotic biosynthesis monooxygenase [Candidatus Rokuibacteriota bacterium]|nr:MAG: antibiotic biosynthesis monooxygenase [Candidatus Rokubacteria bacterium]